ncbi:MAG: sigma-70 family RNA polymerase sigma factor [Deltaproteobacteria bacterium]|jgi:RNA polymerase primary sigma factor|nr:sigma-70 family RNA polymerase sigma factor [Deltaproteobacteria bacterium]
MDHKSKNKTDNIKSEDEKEKKEKDEKESVDNSSYRILSREEEEEIATNMEKSKEKALDIAIGLRSFEEALDDILENVIQDNVRLWRYLEDPRNEGIGETDSYELLEELTEIKIKLRKYGDKISKSNLELEDENDKRKMRNIKRRINRARKNRQDVCKTLKEYHWRNEFLENVSERIQNGIGMVKKLSREEFINTYGVNYDRYKEISQKFFKSEHDFLSNRENLIISNQRLVIYFARKYQNQGVDLVDLIGEGNIGLLRAVERFDPSNGSRLATYATWWIKHNLNRAVANQGSTIRIPGHVREEKNKIIKVITRTMEEEDRKPTVKEIADEVGIPVEKVNYIMRRTQNTISMDRPLGDNQNDDTLQKLIPDKQSITPEEEVSKEFDKILISDIISELKPRERMIIEMRYGLGGKESSTLQKVGDYFDITRERVRQLQTKAEKKLYQIASKKGYNKNKKK